jgi:hypothetical protein
MCMYIYNSLRFIFIDWAWWCTPLIPAFGRQRQADFWVWGQPGLQSEFQDSYTEKPCLEKQKTNKQTKRFIFMCMWVSVSSLSVSLTVCLSVCLSLSLSLSLCLSLSVSVSLSLCLSLCMCVCVCVCVCVYVCVCRPRAEDGIRSLGAAVTVGYELPDMGARKWIWNRWKSGRCCSLLIHISSPLHVWNWQRISKKHYSEKRKKGRKEGIKKGRQLGAFNSH